MTVNLTVTASNGATTSLVLASPVVDTAQPVSLFTTQTPAQPSVTDTPSADYELGMKFSISSNGTISAIRYWKAASETGTHTGRIWSATGTLLASVVFAGETASGWQQQALITPLAITAGTQYVVSVNVSTRYAVTTSGFASAISNGPLTAPVNAGVFNGTPGSFPTTSFSNSNYFRDIVLIPGAAPPLTVPVVTAGSFGVSLPASGGQVVGTMTATQSPTAWAITAGNTAGYFSISNAGVINVTSGIVAGNYSLTCRATNSAGNGTGAASITAAVPAAGTIPMSFNDPIFTGMTENNNPATLSNGQSLTRRSMVATHGNPMITSLGNNTVSFCRANGREGIRITDGSLTVESCYLETRGTGDDHADTLQAYSPGAAGGTITLQNSHIRAYPTDGGGFVASVGYFTADSWSGTIRIENCLFNGGAFGLRTISDPGCNIDLYMNNVFFVGPFGNADILLQRIGSGVLTVRQWVNVRNATIVNGVLVPGTAITNPG